MTKPKDKAAQALAAKRWAKTGKRERKRHGAMLAQARADARAKRAGAVDESKGAQDKE